VGEPITLTITVTGPEYLDALELPPLENQADLVRDFRVPRERASGKTDGTVKVFTQTLRALNDGVKEIPPIQLPYFDTRTEKYAVAKSDPIPLAVRAAKAITIRDAEGRTPTATGRALQAWSSGIRHNYEDLDCLADQQYGPRVWVQSPAWMFLLVGPPGIYFALLLATASIRRRHADPAARRARRAYRAFRRGLQARTAEGVDPCAAVLAALRDYLGSKLRMAAGALTYADVERPLRERGVGAETLKVLRQLFERCIAGRYAGSAGSEAATGDLAREAERTVNQLEEVLK
jgi:hypothetical protein